MSTFIIADWMCRTRMLLRFIMMIFQYQHSPKKKVLEKDLFSLEGCIEELKSFSLNKFRGNDGLPVECLRLFGVQ